LVLAKAAAAEKTIMNAKKSAALRIDVVLLIIPYLPYVENPGNRHHIPHSLWHAYGH
jgi:hypothetical protein